MCKIKNGGESKEKSEIYIYNYKLFHLHKEFECMFIIYALSCTLDFILPINFLPKKLAMFHIKHARKLF
mgnify:CR=1 FL=1